MHSGDGVRTRSLLGYLVVVAAAAALVFEQSPANEIVRTNAAISMLQRTGSAVWVGVVVFAVTVVIEFVAALLITLGLHARGGAVQGLKARMIRRRAEKLDQTEERQDSAGRKVSRFGADVAVALALGAGLVTLRRHVTDPAPTIRRDLKVSAQATAIVAVVSGLVGYLLGGGLANAHRVGLERPAELIIEYGVNQWFWISVLVIGYGVVLLVRLVRYLVGRVANGRGSATAQPARSVAPSTAPAPMTPSPTTPTPALIGLESAAVRSTVGDGRDGTTAD